MAIENLHIRTKVLVALFIIIGAVFRWTELDLRPLHHDESIHVMFGKYYYDDPETGYYKYDPEYHGPLLYTALRYGYKIFGDNEKTARGIIAFMGTCLLLMPFLLRRYLTEGLLIVSTAAIAISPTMIFWSRFVREDMFVFAGMALCVYGVLAAPSKQKSLFVLMGIVFQYASKENSYVTLALFWAFCVFEFLWRKHFEGKDEPVPCTLFAPLPFASVIIFQLGMAMEGTKYHMVQMGAMHVGALAGFLLIGIDVFRSCWKDATEENSIIVRLFGHIARYRLQFIGAAIIASLFFCYLFSAAGRYPIGILDGLYQKGITYWMEKHAIERIKGPFLFHFYMLSWYELAFMLVILLHAIHFYLSYGKFFRYIGAAVVALALLVGFYNIPHSNDAWYEPTFFLWKKFKLKDWFDIVGFILIIIHPALVTFGHALERRWNLCFFGYWFTASFFTYSYLGEKVPWLSAYPIIAGFCYFPAYWMQRVKDNEESVDLASVVKTTALLIISITALFVPFYYLKTRTPADSLFANFPQLMSQSGACIGFALFLLLLVQVQRRTGILSRPTTGWGIFVIYCLFTLRIAYMVNFVPEKFELGYISQVHTTTELLQLARSARVEAEKPGGDVNRRIMVNGDAAWPLVWYFRNLPAYSFNPNGDNKSSFYYIFQNTDDASPPEFNRKEIGLRGWWVPDFREMTLFRFLNMSLNLQTWGGYGFSKVAYLERR